MLTLLRLPSPAVKPMFGLTAILLLALALASCHGVHGSDREVIATPNAPRAIGPYSQGIRVGNTLYCAGQIGMDPRTGTMADGVEAQTEQALDNLGAVLEAGGFSFADVVQAQVFLADLNDYAAVNAIYAKRFGKAPPARAAVQVARLPRDARVEILMTAVR